MSAGVKPETEKSASEKSGGDESTSPLFNTQRSKPKYVQNVEQHQHMKI